MCVKGESTVYRYLWRAVKAIGWGVNDLTDVLQWYGYERSAKAVIEEALEDVERDVGQAGVDIGVHSQHHHVSSHQPTCYDVTLKHTNTRTRTSFSSSGTLH